MEVARVCIFVVSNKLGASSSKYIEKWENGNIETRNTLGCLSRLVKINEGTLSQRSIIVKT